MYGVETTPVGSDAVVIVSPAATVSVSVACADCCGFEESTTRTVKLKLPTLDGVPEMTPVCALIPRPGGRLPFAIDHVSGMVPPDALSAALYALPVKARGSVMVVIVSGFETASVNMRVAVF